jgi:hypothetical protein
MCQPSESLINFKRWNVKTHLSNKNGKTHLYECKGRKKFLCKARLRIDRAADSSLSSISFAYNHSLGCEQAFNEEPVLNENIFKAKTLKRTVSELIESKITVQLKFKDYPLCKWGMKSTEIRFTLFCSERKKL